MNHRYLSGTLLISLFFLFAPISKAKAQLIPFGGRVSYTVACTCPGSIGNLWIYFTPFWLSSVPIAGSLVYVPYVSKLYSWYEIGVAGTYHLGSYVPGVQACWMLLPTTPPSCAPLLSAGVITQVGTSKSF